MSSIDIIIPCYRYGHFLRECVESVLSDQCKHDIRVLVIDDASPDNTAKVAAMLAREDSRVTFLQHTINKGHIATYNEGIAWASADYMLILSADDYLLPGALSRSISFMDEHPEIGFTFGKTIQLKNNGTGNRPVNDGTDNNKAYWRIFEGKKFIEISGAVNIVSAPSVVVRTKLQKSLGGYRPELPHSCDMEMWLRIAAHSFVGFYDGYQAVYRRHGDNMSLNYTGKSWLPDIQQRKAALDCFFQTCDQVLLEPKALQRRLFWLLGCETVGCASDVFNHGDLVQAAQLSEYALAISPQVKRSFQWAKLTCKRCVGYKVWSVLLPVIVSIRQFKFQLGSG